LASAGDRAEFIRQSMRQTWSVRRHSYAEGAARNSATYAARLLAMLALRSGERVLDVATGPGVVAIQAAAAVGPAGRVVATDLTPEWEAIVAERCAAVGVSNVTFRAMGAEALDLPNESFDVVCCQFGLMFVPDRVQALREMRRVLRPGGRLGLVVWSTADRVLCFSVIDRLVGLLVPQPPPEERLPGPLSLGEPGTVERLVAAAGFGSITVERHTLDYVSDDPEQTWRLRVVEGAPAVRAAVQALTPEARADLHDTVVAALERYRQGGRIILPSEAIFVTAVR
jgi:SAM-dependent methyltransferase